MAESQDLSERIDELELRLASIEHYLAQVTRPAAQPPPPRSIGAQSPPPHPTGATPVAPLRPAPGPSGPSAPGTSVERGPAVPRTWPATEQLLKWGGLALVFLAAVFAVSTAIDRGWIGPVLQLLGAILGGAGLVAGGVHLHRTRTAWGHPLVGAGLAVLFTSAGAAHGWLDLVPLWVAGLGVVAVSGLGTGLARMLGRQWLALIAFAGLIIVPTTLHAWDTWSASVLALGLVGGALVSLAVSFAPDWPLLRIIVSYVAAVLLLPTAGAALGSERLGHRIVMTIAAALLAVAWWASPWLARQWRRAAAKSHVGRGEHSPAVIGQPDTDGGSGIIVGSGIIGRLEPRAVVGLPLWVWLFLLTVLPPGGSSTGAGWLAIGWAAFFALVVAAERGPASSVHRLSQLAAIAILLTAASALLLDGGAVLVAIALLALVVFAAGRTLADGPLVLIAVVLGAWAVLYTVVRMIVAVRDDARLLDDLANIAVLLAMVAAVWTVTRHHEHGGTNTARLFGVAALAGLLLWLLSVLIHVPQGQVVVSISWAAVGVSVLVIGALRSRADLGGAGLGVLSVTVLKLLTVDLTEVDTFWRAGLFLIVGGALVRVAYALPGLTGTDRAEDQPLEPEGPPPES